MLHSPSPDGTGRAEQLEIGQGSRTDVAELGKVERCVVVDGR
jgi:hypothetical protein